MVWRHFPSRHRGVCLYSSYESIKKGLHLSGVMEFFADHAERASLAEQQHHSTMLPLLWKSKEELNESYAGASYRRRMALCPLTARGLNYNTM